MQQDPRRQSPRIDIEALCWEVIGERELSSLVVDLSTEGARIERPFMPTTWRDASTIELGPAGRSGYGLPSSRNDRVPLQIEVPGIDEVMWARGDVVFDELVPARANGGPFGMIRRTGYRIAIAARRDLHLLSDFVWDTHAKLRAEADRERERDFDRVDWAVCFG